jgi:hypothetical protein
MMGDRQFASRAVSEWLDPLGVIILGTVGISVLTVIAMLYVAHQNDLERNAFQKVCVDSGGYPVVTYSYIKGSKDGRLCINPSAIIEVN